MSHEVSVVVPSLGRPSLAATLSRQLHALTPAPAEVLFVFQDDDDRRRFHEQEPAPSATALLAPQRSAGLARNWGAQHAQSPVVAFLDDDCAPCDERWLHWLTAPLVHGRVVLTTGAVRGWDAASGRIPGLRRAFRLLPPFLEPVGRPDSAVPGNCDTVAGGNFAVRRTQFLDVGGFSAVFPSPSLYEETELSIRMRRRTGGVIRFVPEAAVVHHQAVEGGMRASEVRADPTFVEQQRWLLLKEVYGETASARLRFAAYRAARRAMRGVRGLR